MARQLDYVKLKLTMDDTGVPQSAIAEYRVSDGAALKGGTYEVPTPDFTKVMHNAGTTGEFWKDLVDAIKSSEGI